MTCHALRPDGEVCGRPVRGFVARGHGRCGFHLTRLERLRVRAVLRVELSLRPKRQPLEDFDVDRFAGDELAE